MQVALLGIACAAAVLRLHDNPVLHLSSCACCLTGPDPRLSIEGPCCRTHEQGEEQLAQILNEGITAFICLQVSSCAYPKSALCAATGQALCVYGLEQGQLPEKDAQSCMRAGGDTATAGDEDRGRQGVCALCSHSQPPGLSYGRPSRHAGDHRDSRHCHSCLTRPYMVSHDLSCCVAGSFTGRHEGDFA